MFDFVYISASVYVSISGFVYVRVSVCVSVSGFRVCVCECVCECVMSVSGGSVHV